MAPAMAVVVCRLVDRHQVMMGLVLVAGAGRQCDVRDDRGSLCAARVHTVRSIHVSMAPAVVSVVAVGGSTRGGTPVCTGWLTCPESCIMA